MAVVEQLIIDHIDLWAAAIKRKSAAGRGSSGKIDLYGIKKLRALILELAVRGLLVPQDLKDEPASELLKKIAAEKAKLAKEGKLKKDKSLPPVGKEEKSFELPNGWLWERFGNLAEHNAGKTLDQGRNQGELRNYITTSNLYWGRFDLSVVRQMPIENADLEKCLALTNDLLICEGGEAGRAAVWNHDYPICFQNHVHRARFWHGINPYYAYRLLEKMSYSGEINNYRKGVGISNMSGKALGSIPFPLPPLAEQHRIVDKIDELMALCNQLEQQTAASLNAHQALVETVLKVLISAADHEQFVSAWQFVSDYFDTLFTSEESIDQLKRTILQLAVVGKLVPQDPNDEPASELLKEIAAEKTMLIKAGKIKKEKPQSPIIGSEKPFECPAGWEFCRLQEAIDVRDGTHDSPKDATGDKTYPLVTSKNFINGEIDFDSARRISEEDHLEISRRSQVDVEDILFSMIGGNIGNQVMVRDPRAFSVKNVAIFKYFLKSATNPHFFFLYTQELAAELQEKASGGAQPFVSLGFLRNLVFALPPKAEQQRIVAKVDELMVLCDQLKSRLNDAQLTQLHLADALTDKALARA